MSKERHNITEHVLLDYLEGTLSAQRQREVQEWLQRDAVLRRAYERLQAEERDLFALGRDLRTVAPSICVVDSVLRVLEDEDAIPDDVEKELFGTGGLLNARMPRVDLVAAVMDRLPGEEDVEASTPLEQELISVGNVLRARAPRVSLVPPVLEAVERESTGNVVSLTEHARQSAARRRAATLSWRLIAGAAAGVVLGLAFLLTQMMQPVRTGQLDISKRISTQQPVETRDTPDRSGMPEQEQEPAALTQTPVDGLDLLSALTRPASPGDAEPEEDGESLVQAGFTIEDILLAKQRALAGQADALAMLARWGALDPDEVRRLLAEGLLTPMQLAGLSRFLPDAEAAELLRQAIEQNPDDPALRLALAKQLLDDSSGYAEASEHLAALRQLAPDNALVHYMDAQLRFAMGDYAGALALLEYASGFEAGSAFAVANAQYHSAALQAAGMPADLADTLASFYAGTDEYGAVSQLRNELLGYGAYFESLGDFDTAMAIYKSVGLLGQQLTGGAGYTNEYLAGLDTQMAAIEAMSALAELMHVPGGLQTIQNTYEIFVESLNIFLNYTSLLDSMLHIGDISAFLNVVNGILQTGDIRYLQNLLM